MMRFIFVFLVAQGLSGRWRAKMIDSPTVTLPETNIAPENRPSQKETSIPAMHFRVRLLLVSGRVDY